MRRTLLSLVPYTLWTVCFCAFERVSFGISLLLWLIMVISGVYLYNRLRCPRCRKSAYLRYRPRWRDQGTQAWAESVCSKCGHRFE